jgi:hypothetical protein
MGDAELHNFVGTIQYHGKHLRVLGWSVVIEEKRVNVKVVPL